MKPEIVLGPPGTGKTTTLLGMVDHELAQGTPPDKIGYVSFTRRAAQEAQERARVRFALKPSDLPYFRTLHSLCFWALGLATSDVLDGPRLVEFGDWIGVKVTGHVSMEEGRAFGYETGDRILYMENLARVRCVSLREQYNEDPDDLPWNLVDRVGRALLEYKKAKAVYDYTDMLTMLVDTNYNPGLEVLFVDEAQDLSILQWRVVEKLAADCRRVVVAGDDDQAIYRWAGAAVDTFVSMPGEARVLGQSWRVPPLVQATSNEVISRVRSRRPKTWAPRSDIQGVVKRVQTLDEIDFGTGEETLILARNTCFLRDDAMPLLRSQGILYEFRGGGSVRGSLVEAILDWERLRKGEAVPVENIIRVYENMTVGNRVVRGHKKLPGFEDKTKSITMDDLLRAGGLKTTAIWHEAMDKISPEDRAYMVKALRRGDRITKRPNVKLSTIHGSKGGEAKHVVIIRDVAYRTWKEADKWPDDEARVWYVGLTRAKERLTIVAPQTRRGYDL